MSTVKKIS